jgi:PBP1b-binding outer membrane lipoprotein LpoB
MKRTFACALIAGALLLAGCSRPHAEAPSSPAPASSTAPAHKTAAHKTAGTSGEAAAPATSDDVSDLLNQVDKQLNSNDQPSSEQD